METEVKQLQKKLDTLQLDVNELKLRALMGSAKALPEEERKARVKEMEKIRKEKGERALDRFLSRKLGLKF